MSDRLQRAFLLVADVVAQAFAFALGAVALSIYGSYSSVEALREWWAGTGEIHTIVHFVFVGLVILRFYIKGLYRRRLPFWDELRQILSSVIYLAVLNGMVVLIAKWPFSRVLWLSSWTLALVLIPILRALVRTFMMRGGYWSRPTIIVGVGETAWSTFAALRSEGGLGFKVLKFLNVGTAADPEIVKSGIPIETLQRDDMVAVIERLAREHRGLQVVIALEQSDYEWAAAVVERLNLVVSDIYLVPTLVGLPIFGMEAQHFFSHEVLLLHSRNNLGFRPRYVLKRAFDLVVATVGLIAISPLLAWIGLRIRASGPGIFFIQPRVGYNGKTFYCYKFRTMIPDAEMVLQDLLDRDPIARKEWNEKTKITNDPRITAIGQFLRKTSLDELPQLVNVIRGDMSLVGPRPLLLHEVEKYGSRLSFYHNAKPGITGLWQVSGRSDTDYGKRIYLDTWYVKNWSLWYDIAILFKTVNVVFKRDGAY